MSEPKCWSGDGRAVDYTDPITLKGFCATCASNEFISSQHVYLQFLKDIIPFEVGNRVECRTVGVIYDGTGKVIEVSTELKDGGTEYAPAYRVQLDKGDQKLWYTGKCLTLLPEWRREAMNNG